jgi:hypothetical protein
MISLLLFSALVPFTMQAAESVHVCPARIDAAWNVASAPEGWDAFGSGTVERHHLRGATFTYGHPRARAFLKPSATPLDRSAPRTDVYRFSASYPDGVWLVCRYVNTPAIVFKRLPGSPKSCRVTHPVNAARSAVQTIACRY